MTLPATQTKAQLPAHLLNFAGFSLNKRFIGGLKLSGGHPSIGIKGSKWRLKENGAEELVNSLTLDVVIVDANDYVSKVFYASSYNPGDEIKAPDCFSDNGTGPSSQATSPQSSLCATCPKNAWGSKINPNGAKSKACSDYKKLAVVLADDVARNVFELRIPAASLKPYMELMVKLDNNGIPIPALVFQLSFDASADYPKIVFKPTGYIDAEQAEGVKKWMNSEEAKRAVGKEDIQVVGAIEKKPEPKINEDEMAFLAQEPAKKRGRPPAAKVAPVVEDQLVMDLPGVQPAAQATTIKPQPTNADLDNILAGIL